MKRSKVVIWLVLVILVIMNSNFSFQLLADDELTFAVCEESGILKAFNILGYLVTIIKVLVPVILIITGIKSLFKAMIDDDSSNIKKSANLFITKFIVGAFIFFIPALFNALFSVVSGYDQTKVKFTDCAICLTNTKSCKMKISKAEAKEEREKISAEEKKEDKKEIKPNVNATPNNNQSVTVKPSTATSYGKGCTGYVSSSSYNSSIVQKLLNRANTKVGVSYSKMDCSDFVSYVFKDYIPDNTAAGLGKVTRDRCVRQEDVQPGDIFLTSNYDSSGKCQKCMGATHGNRCNRYNCIMHVGIVTEVKNGKVTKIVHSSGKGVHYKVPTYRTSPNGSGSSWYIAFTRPYA